MQTNSMATNVFKRNYCILRLEHRAITLISQSTIFHLSLRFHFYNFDAPAGEKSLFSNDKAGTEITKQALCGFLSVWSVLSSTAELNSYISQSTAELCTSTQQLLVYWVTMSVHAEHQNAYKTNE